MAASDTRSPPARPTVHDRLGIFSSSPDLPDLRDLAAARLKPKPQTIRSGSAAIPIPPAASTTFTSASDLLRITRAIGNDSFDVIDEPEPPVAKKAPAKRVRKTTKDSKVPKEPKVTKATRSKKDKAPKRLAKEVIVLSSDGVTPRPTRHEDSTAAAADVLNDHTTEAQEDEVTPLNAKPWKKFKSTPSLHLPETGDAEPGPAKVPAKAKAQKNNSKSEVVSRHFAKDKDSVESNVPEVVAPKEKRSKAARASTPEPINLDAAVERRMDWTPAKPDTLLPQSSPDPFATPEDLSTANADGNVNDAAVFEKLHEKYGHKTADAAASAVLNKQAGQVLGKRKVIEMVSVNMSSRSTETIKEPSPAKAKAQKKKARTITELATAAYGPQVEEESRTEDSLLEYFSVQGEDHDAPKNAAAAKGKGKAPKATKSRKKVPPKKPLLLSPQAALKQSAAQDFVFGTASQLACEKSPTFLKDLHAAMKASTIAEEGDPFVSPSVETNSKSKLQGKGLWSISARDEEGDLVDVEIIDMINAPALPQDDAILDPWTQLPPEAALPETETADSSVIEIDSRPVATLANKSSQPPIPKSHFFMTQKMTINTVAALSPKTPDNSFPLITDLLDEMPPPSNQQQTQEEVRDSPSKKIAPVHKPRPKYESFTDAKLAKEVSKFGFKAVKTRSGMIALLDQCWKSRSETALGGAIFAATSLLASPKRKQTEVAQDAPTSPPPAKKPRAKPKATAAAEALGEAASRNASPGAKDVSVAPKKKPGRPRKDAVMKDVSAATKKTAGRPRKATAAEEKTAASSMPPPPRPKAAPSTPNRKKTATQAKQATEDLDLDSEIEASGSSPEQLFSPGGTSADVTISDDTEVSLNLSPTALQAEVFSYITKAVTTAPRTIDPQNPSWHEKMLMYDPVILEDLTTWLNSGELTRLGHDDEVSAQDVKKWCESRSVCCLWKGNWHGKERKRF